LVRRLQNGGTERIPARAKHADERLLHRCDCRTADLDPRIAPGRNTACRISDPHPPDAQPGDESDASVDRQQLAMIAMQNIERACEAEWIEGTHFDAGGAERAPEAARRAVERAQPVVDQSDDDAVTRTRGERIGKLRTDLVVADEVVLEQDAMLRTVNRREPCRIVLA